MTEPQVEQVASTLLEICDAARRPVEAWKVVIDRAQSRSIGAHVEFHRWLDSAGTLHAAARRDVRNCGLIKSSGPDCLHVPLPAPAGPIGSGLTHHENVDPSFMPSLTATDSGRRRYRPALDGLRGVAIAIVMLNHAGIRTFQDSGNVGVTLFFVLSGFLITTLLLDERERSGRIDVRAFYIRRAMRLLPALALMLVVVTVLMLAVGRADEIVGDVIPTLFYFMNWTKVAGDDPGFLSHAWSLSIEEQFYIAWPFVFLGFMALFRGRVIPIATVVLAGAVGIAAWRVALWEPGALDRVYWSTDTRADALLVGCSVALVLSTRSVSVPALAACAAAAALAGVTFLTDVSSFATMGLAVVSVAGAVLMVAALQEGPVERALSWRPLVSIGAISYGLYLFHRPIMRLGSSMGLEGQAIPALAMIALSIGAAWLSWRFVERPFLRLKDRPWATSRIAAVPMATPSPVSFLAERPGSNQESDERALP